MVRNAAASALADNFAAWFICMKRIGFDLDSV
jgi:hypothetical protein